MIISPQGHNLAVSQCPLVLNNFSSTAYIWWDFTMNKAISVTVCQYELHQYELHNITLWLRLLTFNYCMRNPISVHNTVRIVTVLNSVMPIAISMWFAINLELPFWLVLMQCTNYLRFGFYMTIRIHLDNSVILTGIVHAGIINFIIIQRIG